MWKYVTRRIRDTFERSANHFDILSSTVINSSNGHLTEDNNKSNNSNCCWFIKRNCSNSFHSENDTHSNKWNFEQTNRTWIGAITWTSGLVFGWYTSQLINLNLKKRNVNNRIHYLPKNSYLLKCLPFLDCIGNKTLKPVTVQSQLEGPLLNVNLISNDHSGDKESKAANINITSSNSSQGAENDLGKVLNSIENKLGLAAIENGQHQDGLNLLRSAANRNHAPALYNLGLCYELGLGVVVNEKMAMEQYRSAAALQHPGALYNLGIYYGQGRGGLAQDRVTAIRLFRLAAVQGQEAAIAALKSIEENITPQSSLFFKPDNIKPAHSDLFCENVYSLQTCNYKYEPAVY